MRRLGVRDAAPVFRWTGLFMALLALAIGVSYAGVMSGSLNAAVLAEEPPKSTNFIFEESVVGGGGLQNSSSASYQFTSTLGENAVGPSASTNFQDQAGNKTSPDPVLGFAVTNANVNFGQFSASAGTTATANFVVSNYTSYGYAVNIVGTTPRNGSKVIPAMGTTGPDAPEDPAIGTEQFGLNLVANTVPNSVGANPNQGQFGFGVATSLYNQANKYRFANGEAIATAPKSSGITEYTISYVVNVAALTVGGQYTASQTLVCTGTF